MRIAVLDDNQSVLESLLRVLRNLGHQTHGFRQPQELIAFLMTETIEVLIVDQMLEENTSGWELVSQIREKIDLPVVVITGFASSELKEQIKNSPNTKLLNKPFSVETLTRELLVLTT